MTFPTLTPSSRTYSPGDYPHTAFSSWDGQQSRVRHSNVMLKSTVQLRFQGLTEEQLLNFISHYNSMSGTFLTFTLPVEVFSGTSDASAYTLSGYQWRYLEPPVIEDLPCNIYNIEILLESITPEGATVSGQLWGSLITWTPGNAVYIPAGNATAPEQFWPVFAEWGAAAQNGVGFGERYEMATAWAPGLVNGTGSRFNVTATWVPGIVAGETDNFAAVTYTGNGSTQSITGLPFKPSFVWIKRFSTSAGANEHFLYDEVRGPTKYWRSNQNTQEVTDANSLTSFDSGGFSIGSSTVSNANTAQYVAWCWSELPTASTNNDGSISTNLAVDSAKGIAICTYTGTSANATIGHGLGGSPDFVLIKNLENTFGVTPALVGSPLIGANYYLSTATTGTYGATLGSNTFRGFSSTTISLGSSQNINQTGLQQVCYAFRSVSGVSKIDTFTGAGSLNKSITTGFQPQFVLIKATSATGDWMFFDAARGATSQLLQTVSNATTVDKITFDADGFTVKANQNTNTSGVTYLYLAFK